MPGQLLKQRRQKQHYPDREDSLRKRRTFSKTELIRAMPEQQGDGLGEENAAEHETARQHQITKSDRAHIEGSMPDIVSESWISPEHPERHDRRCTQTRHSKPTGRSANDLIRWCEVAQVGCDRPQCPGNRRRQTLKGQRMSVRLDTHAFAGDLPVALI